MKIKCQMTQNGHQIGGGGARINARPLGLGETKKTKKLKLAPKWMSSKPCILNFYTEFEFPHQFF